MIAKAGRQPITAQKHPITDDNRNGYGIQFYLGLKTNCAGDNMGFRVPFAFFPTQKALINHVLDHCMIARQQPQMPLPHQIGTAIACPDHMRHGVLQHHCHHGRAHLTHPRLSGFTLYHCIGAVQRCPQGRGGQHIIA
jgi:hypothetical protein